MDVPPSAAVTAFDALAPGDLAPHLRVCLHSEEWVDAVLAGRPYRSVAALEAAAATAALALSDPALEQALAAHPRIGERPADGAEASQHSRREQAGISTDDATAARLREANLAYEARFGRVFLLRAAGLSAEDVLAAAERRLGHDDATEAREVRRQLGEIAVLRLGGLLDRLAEQEVPR